MDGLSVPVCRVWQNSTTDLMCMCAEVFSARKKKRHLTCSAAWLLFTLLLPGLFIQKQRHALALFTVSSSTSVVVVFFSFVFFFFWYYYYFFFFHPYPFQTHTDTILAGFNSTYLAKTCKFVRSEGVMVRAVNSPGQTGSLQILNRESPGLQIYVCNLQILRRIFWSPDIHL